MKNLLFITKSKLTPNLMNLILPELQRKTSMQIATNLNKIDSGLAKKKWDLVVIDDSAFQDFEAVDFKTFFINHKLQQTTKIAFQSPKQPLSPEVIEELGLLASHSKPFLPENLVQLLNTSLGNAK